MAPSESIDLGADIGPDLGANPGVDASPGLGMHLGLEARARAGDHLDLRIWLRLLALANQIEAHIRQRLRARFGTTLSRFDYLAQLERHPAGLRMSQLSRHLMVTGGNVTGLTDELVKEGLVERTDDPDDRRSWRVRLTAAGRHFFGAMAVEHETWLNERFAGLPVAEKEALYALLGRLRQVATEPATEPTTTRSATTRSPATRTSTGKPPARKPSNRPRP